MILSLKKGNETQMLSICRSINDWLCNSLSAGGFNTYYSTAVLSGILLLHKNNNREKKTTTYIWENVFYLMPQKSKT